MSYYPYLDKQFITRALEDYQIEAPNYWKSNLNSQILQKYLEIKRKGQFQHQKLPFRKIFPNSYNFSNYQNSNENYNRIRRIQSSYDKKYQKNSRSQPNLLMKFSHYQNTPTSSVKKNIKNECKPQITKSILMTNSQKSLSQTNLSPSFISKISSSNKKLLKSNNQIQSDFQVSMQKQNQQFISYKRIQNSKSKKDLIVYDPHKESKGQIKSAQNFLNFQNNPIQSQYFSHSKPIKENYNRCVPKSSQIKQKKITESIKHIEKNNIEEKLIQYYGDQFERIKAERDYLRKNFILHLQNKHTKQLPYNSLTKIKTDQSNNKLILQKQIIPQKNKDNKKITIQIPRVYKC